MPISFVFWLLMLLWLLFGVWRGYTGPGWPVMAGDLLLFVVIALLGWQVFGNPIR